ncbi:hypothetical protein DTO013E5_9169 [Penicillium roqueforti]|nr:hypothetical protein DTO012A1_8705 [Penicillium roqueforti]KAI2740259.1 hypothetical protein DTO013F2_9142 [Penicillium roqueforti]KAI2756313.1 hypothetical protein DTO006G1_7953 [Penicillium roqueforti]KAI2766739.1 hypothetical protein DTO012A8_8049 [Penicillium roqueforti]KAI3199898.1 hypothetical protein DTO013E5_9169 [Penicillium roqueforti]
MHMTYCDVEMPQRDIGSYKLPASATPEQRPQSMSFDESEKTRPTCSQPITTLPKVECAVRARIPTTTGSELWLHVYQNDIDNKEHLAFVFGDQIKSRSLNMTREGDTEMGRMIRGAYSGRLQPGCTRSHSSHQLDHEQKFRPKADPPLVRVHSECYTGETAWSARCDCGDQLDEAARMMIASWSGVIVYLRQEGRGIGLKEKLKAYNLQDMGLDTVDANLSLGLPADARTYGIATAILMDLGLGNDSGSNGIRLLTNNPEKLEAIEGPHKEITVKERVPMIPLVWTSLGDEAEKSPELYEYIRTKFNRMGHLQ